MVSMVVSHESGVSAEVYKWRAMEQSDLLDMHQAPCGQVGAPHELSADI